MLFAALFGRSSENGSLECVPYLLVVTSQEMHVPCLLCPLLFGETAHPCCFFVSLNCAVLSCMRGGRRVNQNPLRPGEGDSVFKLKLGGGCCIVLAAWREHASSRCSSVNECEQAQGASPLGCWVLFVGGRLTVWCVYGWVVDFT
mmetsp:Transcript_42473/g.83725  ORF Transcript_42473/g.83725 Transcript_42473/m.83725 type:complete len:145 (-) Transcript_42473:995-1429(-)